MGKGNNNKKFFKHHVQNHAKGIEQQKFLFRELLDRSANSASEILGPLKLTVKIGGWIFLTDQAVHVYPILHRMIAICFCAVRGKC